MPPPRPAPDPPTLFAAPATPRAGGWVEGRSPARQRLVLALVAMAVAAVGQVAVMSFSIPTAPFFFDEMWRADFIRSSDPFERMYAHDTPAAIGYVGLMRLLTFALPYHPFTFRFWSLAAFTAFVGVASAICHRVASAPPRGRWTSAGWPDRPLPAGAVALAPALLAYVPATQWYRYLNNYPFEMLYGASMVFAVVSLPGLATGAADHEEGAPRWAMPTLCLLVALGPLFQIGGLFLLPGVLAAAAWWAWRQPGRAGPLAAVGASGVVATVLALVMYVRVYRPVVDNARITDDWVALHASLGGHDSLWDLALRTGTQARDGLLGLRLSTGSPTVLGLATLVLVAAFAVGVVAVVRRNAWLVVIPTSAWLLAVVASAAVAWPMTLERVNLAFTGLLMVVCAMGFVRMACWPFEDPRAGLAVVVASLWVIWPQYIDPAANAFSRALPADLAVVRDSPAEHNVVFAYHPLSQFYVDDALINDAPAGRFTVVRDRTGDGDDSIDRPLDPLLRRAGARPGDMVWCVIPFEVGARTTTACRFDQTSVVPVYDQRLGDTIIRGYRLASLGS